MKKKKKRHLFEIEILHNITNVFTLTFDKLQTVLDSAYDILLCNAVAFVHFSGVA